MKAIKEIPGIEGQFADILTENMCFDFVTQVIKRSNKQHFYRRL